MLLHPRTLLAVTFLVLADSGDRTRRLHAQDAAELSLQELTDGLGARARHFLETDSFYVEFAYGGVERFAKSKIVDRVAGPTIAVARQGSNLYANVVDPTDPRYGSKGLLSVYLADENILVQTNNATYATITANPDALVYQWWAYTDNQHFNVYKYVSGLEWRRAFPPAIQPILLPEDIYDNRDEYRVLPQQKKVDGVVCHVIDRANVGRFWVDPARGFAIVRTELYWTGIDPPGLLKLARTNRDFQEVKPGLWLPMKQVEDLYADPNYDAHELWGKRILRWTLGVHRLEFDALSDGFFKVEIPEGVLVDDQIRKIQYQSELGEPFDDAIQFGRRARSPQWFWLLLLNAVAAGGILIYILVRRIRAMRIRG